MWRIIAIAAVIIIGAYLGRHPIDAEPAEQTSGGQPLCTAQIYDAAPPTIPAKMTARSYMICAHGYDALSSGLTKTGLWSAERLDPQRIEAARHLERVNSFHPEETIPPDDRADLEDYRHSGYDRGHLAPNGDSADPVSQAETFSLGQMIPQNPDNNRRLWADIESTVRDLAEDDGTIWVVTGPLFRGSTLVLLNHRLYVPTEVWKAVYDPKRQTAGVYITYNAPGRRYQIVSVAAFISATGIDPFPALSQSVKSETPDLPPPRELNRY